METVFFFKHMTGEQEEILRDYFDKKTAKIEKVLKHFPKDAVLLQVKGERFQKHSAFEVEMVMKLPLGTISAREASHTINKAVDLALDRLMMQLKKTLLGVRREQRSVRARNKVKIRAAVLF